MVKSSLIIMAIAVILMGATSCKDKKKITDNPDPTDNVVKVDEQVVKAKTTLQSLLDDSGSKTIAEKEKILADIKALNLTDPEVADMIKKVEASIEKEKEAIRKAEEDAKPENVLWRYFDGIAKASSEAEANGLIQQVFQMFT